MTSSSAPEDPTYGGTVAVYNAGSTYALNDKVWTGTVGGLITVYQSLQAGNIGHDPTSSPAWWQSLGYTYSLYAAGTSYALGDRVLVVGTDSHLTYESLQAGNVGHTPASSPTWWLELGPTNRWAMFDFLRNTQTFGVSPLTISITPGVRVNSIASVGMANVESVRVLVTSALGGGTVYDQTVSLIKREVMDWYDYFFLPFAYQSAAVAFTLPPYVDAVISVQFSRATVGGPLYVGGCVLGSFVEIGQTQRNPVSDVLNFSTVTRDEFGNSVLVPRRNVPKTNQTVWADKARTNAIRDVRDALNALPAIYCGINELTDAYFEALMMLAIYKQFSIDIASPKHTIVTLELEEV